MVLSLERLSVAAPRPRRRRITGSASSTAGGASPAPRSHLLLRGLGLQQTGAEKVHRPVNKTAQGDKALRDCGPQWSDNPVSVCFLRAWCGMPSAATSQSGSSGTVPILEVPSRHRQKATRVKTRNDNQRNTEENDPGAKLDNILTIEPPDVNRHRGRCGDQRSVAIPVTFF